MRRLFSFQDGMQLLSGIGAAAGLIISSFAMSTSSHAGTITFGSGVNTFSMEFVTIGNPGNAADTTGIPNPAGAVNYEYGIGKFEVSEDMVDKYNALNPTLQILKTNQHPNLPARSISWYEAARFVNWLNTSTGYVAAYKFTHGLVNFNTELWAPGDAGYNPLNPFRNSMAKFVLPSYDEWYKAAYYDPSNNTYYDFPTGSNSAPTAVASGDAANTAVYNQGVNNLPAEVNMAGGLSPYGVMGLGGNVWEWEESSFDLTNSNATSSRGNRGGSWTSFAISLSPSFRQELNPNLGGAGYGFRVASVTPSSPPPAVPEPTSMAIFGLGALGMAYRARRKAKAKSKQA